MIRLLAGVVCMLFLGLPLALAEHSVPYCYGGEVGYWTPGMAGDQTVLLYLTKQDGELTQENVICRVGNKQRLKAVPLDKLAAYHKEGV
mgnify:CR=1 FL=1